MENNKNKATSKMLDKQLQNAGVKKQIITVQLIT